MIQILLTSLLLTITPCLAENIFTPPEAPFITGPKEEIHRVSLPAGTADAAQALIDAARKEKPEAVFAALPLPRLLPNNPPARPPTSMPASLPPSIFTGRIAVMRPVLTD
jgi:hypothetical protein